MLVHNQLKRQDGGEVQRSPRRQADVDARMASLADTFRRDRQQDRYRGMGRQQVNRPVMAPLQGASALWARLPLMRITTPGFYTALDTDRGLSCKNNDC